MTKLLRPIGTSKQTKTTKKTLDYRPFLATLEEDRDSLT